MLVIRLRRIGRKHDPHYRIVVAEHTAPVQGKFIAELGHYHPKSKEFGLQNDVFLDWVTKGAKPSNTVAKLALKHGINDPKVVAQELHGQPKKKTQEMAKAKSDKAAQPTAPEVKEEVTEEAPAVEADAPEENTEDAVETEAEEEKEVSEESTETPETPAEETPEETTETE